MQSAVRQWGGSWLFVQGVTLPTPEMAALQWQRKRLFFSERFIKLKGTEELRGDICHIAT